MTRRRRSYVRWFLFLIVASCTSRSMPGIPEGLVGDQRPPQQAEFGFADTAQLLAQRGIVLTPLAVGTHAGLLSDRAFAKRLRTALKRHPTWHVLSVHEGLVTWPEPLKPSSAPTYVVEVTGPKTGNCFQLYFARNGHFQGGACFYPKRA